MKNISSYHSNQLEILKLTEQFLRSVDGASVELNQGVKSQTYDNFNTPRNKVLKIHTNYLKHKTINRTLATLRRVNTNSIVHVRLVVHQLKARRQL